MELRDARAKIWINFGIRAEWGVNVYSMSEYDFFGTIPAIEILTRLKPPRPHKRCVSNEYFKDYS